MNLAVVSVTLLISLMVTLSPPVYDLWFFHPNIPALVLIYWVMVIPNQVGVVTAWVAGIVIDIITAAPLGLNAITLPLVAFTTLQIYLQMRLFPVLQQSLSIFGMILFYTIIQFWLRGFIGQDLNIAELWIPAVSSAVIWPLLFILMRAISNAFHISDNR